MNLTFERKDYRILEELIFESLVVLPKKNNKINKKTK